MLIFKYEKGRVPRKMAGGSTLLRQITDNRPSEPWFQQITNLELDLQYLVDYS